MSDDDVPRPLQRTFTLTGPVADRVDDAIAFAQRIGCGARDLGGSDPGLEVTALDPRSLLRVEAWLSRGGADEPTDPLNPYLAFLSGLGSRSMLPEADRAIVDELGLQEGPNEDRELAGEVGRLVTNMRSAVRCSDAAAQAALSLRALAADGPPRLSQLDELRDPADVALPRSMEPLVDCWRESLEELAALCDLVEMAAYRATAATDAAIADLPAHIRPERSGADLLARIESAVGHCAGCSARVD